VVEHDWDSVDRFVIERKTAKEQREKEPQPSTSKGATGGLQLPSQVFASKQIEEIALLKKAAPRSGPRLDWDPEIVETLDDDYKAEKVFTLQDLEAEMAVAEGEEGDELGDFLA
jgi:protein LTV1